MAFSWPWQKKNSSSMDLLREMLRGNATKSGASVTWRSAMEATTALACARVIAEGLAQVPCKVFLERSDGGRDVAKGHALYNLIHRKPNDLQTSFEFFEQMGLHLVFCGNFFAFKNVVRGQVVELLPFEPGMVTVRKGDNGIGSALEYTVRFSDGKSVKIPAENMWHVRGPSWNGWAGLEGVGLAREAIGLALATEEHGARMFSNGARVGGILTTDGGLKEDQVKMLRESWNDMQGGNENAYKTAVLWGGLKWSPVGMQNDQAQLIEQRKFQVEEICRAFRVMPIMVGYSDKAATYASAEQMFLAHVVHTMGPWYKRIEQSIETNLLTADDAKRGYYVKFVVNSLLRGAAADRGEFYAKALGSGGTQAWITPNEVRALEELNPIAGGDVLPKPTNAPPDKPGGNGNSQPA